MNDMILCVGVAYLSVFVGIFAAIAVAEFLSWIERRKE